MDAPYKDSLAYFETYWKSYLKVIKICKTMSECGYDIDGYGTLIDKTTFNKYGTYNKVPGFIFANGMYAYIRPWGWNDSKLQLVS